MFLLYSIFFYLLFYRTSLAQNFSIENQILPNSSTFAPTLLEVPENIAENSENGI